MAKVDVVAAQKSAILAGQDAALEAGLEAVYDQAALDQKASDGTLSQSDVDAAVAAAIAPLNLQIAADAQALSDAQAKAASDLAAVQAALADMTSKEQLEEQSVLALQNAVGAVQSSLDAIKALVLPPVVVPPVPAA